MSSDEQFLRGLSEKIHRRTQQIERVDLTAEDWGLFDAAEIATRELNEAFAEAVNEGCERDEVREAVYAVMSEHGSVGAQDTEPRSTLEGLLAIIYSEPDDVLGPTPSQNPSTGPSL